MNPPPRQTLRIVAKSVAAAACFVAVGALAWRYNRPLSELNQIAERMPAVNLWAAIVLLYAAASTFPMPGRDALKLGSAVLLGFWSIVAVTLGEMLAAATGFALTRFGGRDLVALAFGKRLEPLNRKLQNATWRSIFVLRVLPVTPYRYFNYAAGLVDVPLGAYFFGSLLGISARTAFYQFLFTLFADQLKDRGFTVWQTFLFSLLMAPLMLGTWWVWRKIKKSRRAAGGVANAAADAEKTR
jgi:uncharacterized membrane protein YdjX (TVP38/TMEM64 family)